MDLTQSEIDALKSIKEKCENTECSKCELLFKDIGCSGIPIEECLLSTVPHEWSVNMIKDAYL